MFRGSRQQAAVEGAPQQPRCSRRYKQAVPDRRAFAALRLASAGRRPRAGRVLQRTGQNTTLHNYQLTHVRLAVPLDTISKPYDRPRHSRLSSLLCVSSLPPPPRSIHTASKVNPPARVGDKECRRRRPQDDHAGEVGEDAAHASSSGGTTATQAARTRRANGPPAPSHAACSRAQDAMRASVSAAAALRAVRESPRSPFFFPPC